MTLSAAAQSESIRACSDVSTTDCADVGDPGGIFTDDAIRG
jgi:hypothetical protein